MSDGLPYPSIAALAQSADGYLWVATRNGLARFDGVSFKTFTSANTPALVDDRVTALLAASDGTMWIGTGRGITWYRDGVWSRPKLIEGVDEGGIMAMAETQTHAVVIAESVDRATSNGVASGVFVYQDGRTKEIKHPSGSEMPRIDALGCTGSNVVMLAGRGLFQLQNGRVTDIAEKFSLQNPRLLTMLIEPDATIWFGGPNGLIRHSGSEPRAFSPAEGLPSQSIRSLARDRDANLWVGTSNGLARYGNGKFQSLLINGVESLSNVICLLEDGESNLWVGTDNGLFRVQDVKVATFSQRDGLPVNPTLCVLESRDRTRWVGTIGGGLAHLTPEGIQSLHAKDGLMEESVGTLAEASDGTLWIGYYTKGLSSYSNGKFKHYSPGESVRFRGLVVEPSGQVWAASSDGLFRLEKDAFVRVPLDPAITFPRALYRDPEGGLWVAGGRAFGRLYHGQWTIFRKPAQLELLPYESIFTDHHGTTWILQDGPNVWRVRDGQIRQFRFPELGPLIYTGFEKDDELWINFRAGVARIPLSEFDAVLSGRKAQPSYTLYSDADGMRSRAPNNAGSPGCAVMSDGTLWFSTSMGVVQINPSRIRLNTVIPEVHIEQVLADKVEYAGPALGRIPPGRGELAFQYTALSYVNPSQVRFKYRLDGFDRDWIDAGANREAHYGGLPPGTYRFNVVACNNEGIWTKAPTTCTIVLKPHYYQLWWFYTAVGLAAVGTGAGLYQWRSLRLQRRAKELQRQNTELEQRIAERTAELRRSYEALRSSEYFYHSLVESLPQVILRKDATGRYTYANDAAAELLGRPLGEIIGHTDGELYLADAAQKRRTDDQRVLERHEAMEYEEILEKPNQPTRYLHVKRVPLYSATGEPLGIQILFWDMTVFRDTEHKLKNAQKELVEISRLAGIAEMATGVLHNLGNALNSVKVAAAVARMKVNRSEVARVRRVAEMLPAPGEPTSADRKEKLSRYVNALADQLENDQREILHELQQLCTGIEHVADIIAAQQAGARATGIIESVPPLELVEYACRMNQALLDKHQIAVIREIMPAPEINIDRQKALQIITNLIRNAIESLVESAQPNKRLTIGVLATRDSMLQISVADNGTGIGPENLPRIFEFGFTTKRSGHGFGLHNSAIAAHELGGNLHVHSDGFGKGATFVLELPLASTVPAA